MFPDYLFLMTMPITAAINEIKQNETQPTTNSPTNTTLNNVPHPTMDLTIDDFPTLTPDKVDNQSTPDKNDFSEDSMDQSPAVISNHPLQTHSKDHAKPLWIAKIILTIQHSPKNNATRPYMSVESYTASVSAMLTNYKI